ncbi:SPOR domain-containing protein [Chromobacterium haemolyticum]|uniref:SPOR domain-containing protein n=1 Tax=Chromobacterium haemolyticum TaxID=394935 RepID=A0ABS3GLU1_9NEIS|nr:SPOR domain-containing protein [Chromobacterium haemolyticum]MBK0414631.1 SPOR domain-containing protein [Chromobacterium haemolyticum]MBO0416010.1 SPOR domain-containing protein [Chromobacterium haemolyticum]MBO0499491.1 SPOR domain-containing protein [Chromobacterium haemolyticum]
MKWFLVLVVVLNLLVAMYGSFKQRPPADVRAQEVSPELVKLLPANWKPNTASAPAASASAAEPLRESSAPKADQPAAPKKALEASAPKTPTAKAEAAKSEPGKADAKSEAAKPAETAAVCLQWGPLDEKLLARVKGGVPQLKLKAGQMSEASKEETGGGGRFWVYYPPLATQAETSTLSSELKGKGFDNYIVKSVDFKGHLSLGLFGKEEAAKGLAARLKAAGYDKALVQQKGQKASKTTLSFKTLDAQQADKLKALQKRLTPGIGLNSCG